MSPNKLVVKLNVQTQTTETYTLMKDTESVKISMHESFPEEIPAPLTIVKDIKKKKWLSSSKKFANFKSDDEDGYKINNQMSKFKYQMMQRKNSVKPKQKTEEEELDEYIKFFEKAIDENNYEIIENMEMLYSCTAHYISYYFSFEQFEEQHERNLRKSLIQNKLTFPDLFTRFID